MTNNATRTRKTLAAMVGCLLVIGLASCGSSDNAADAPSGATDGGSDGSGGGGAAKTVKPCQWYTAKEMSTLVGFDVTMEDKETPQALGRECVYNSDADYASITVRPTDAATYDSLKAGAASMNMGGAQVDYPGVGDAAYHNVDAEKMQGDNPSVSLNAKKGDVGIEVELAAASGPAISGPARGIEITSEIAKKALGD